MLEKNEGTCSAQILKEFGKTRQDLEEDIGTLKKWAQSQLHFPEEPSYHIIRAVLLFNKFSIEKAKQKLDMYYTIRGIIPEFFGQSPFSPEMAMSNKVWQIVPLPKLADDYIRILYHRMNPEYYDPKYFDHAKEMAHFFSVIEFLILDDDCYRLHFILDLQGTQMGHVMKLNPMVMKKATVVLEKVYSNSLASFYFVNFSPIFETALNTIIKPVLHPKIQQRIKICSGTDILLEDFGKERMPKDIGGEEKSFEELNDLLLKGFEKHKDRFITLATLKVDESLRPAELKNDDLLGYYGNFKQINFD